MNIQKPKRLKQRIGMVVAIFAAFVLVRGVSPSIFVADSPQIDSNALANLISVPQNFIARLQGVNPTSQDEILTAEIPDVPAPPGTDFAPIAKGVYASEPDASGQRFIKIDRGTRLEKKEVTLDDGRTAIVYIPVE